MDERSVDDLAPEQQRVLLAIHRLGGHATARQVADALLVGENEVRWTLLELEGEWVEILTDPRTRMMSATIPVGAARAINAHLRGRRDRSKGRH